MQESCEQRLLQTSTIPSSACLLQKTAVLLSSLLKLGRRVQESYKQRLLVTSTMVSSACCLQKIAVLLSSVLKLGRLVQESYEQRLLCYVHHAVTSVLLAVCWCPAAFKVKHRHLCTGVM